MSQRSPSSQGLTESERAPGRGTYDRTRSPDELRVSRRQLLTLVRQAQDANPDTPVVISGDRKVPYEDVLLVLDMLQKEHVKRVGLLARPAPSMVTPFLDYGLYFAGWGFAAETGLHAMRLIMSGTFDRFPKLKIVLGHMGEGLPFWLQRIDNR